MLVRRHVPESPRWLMIHGRNDEAEQLVAEIERDVAATTGQQLEPADATRIEIQQREATGFVEIAARCSRATRRARCSASRCWSTQAFVYNAVFFTFSIVLTELFDVDSAVAGLT